MRGSSKAVPLAAVPALPTRNGSCEDHFQTPRTAPGLIPKISELT
ncbi:unnamed protein product, partial [Ectocarpus sp. 12 AP-2014]